MNKIRENIPEIISGIILGAIFNLMFGAGKPRTDIEQLFQSSGETRATKNFPSNQYNELTY